MTLVELAAVLSIIGLLSVVVSAGYGDLAQVRATMAAKADAEAARQAVRAFALRNKRLPCPDFSAFGDVSREGLGGTCPPGAQVGWLPYESLGLTRPDRAVRLRYAVSRGGGVDLVAPAAIPARRDIDGSARLRAALGAAARLPAGTDRPFLTGPGTTASPEDCSRVQSNPAFVLVAPVTDRDDTGTGPPGFDGVNAAMAATGQTCVAAPTRRGDNRYDDVVVAEGASVLLGWVAAQTR
ncbi:MAG TPA: hypothetical protein DCM32_02970 [Xanthomonadaceae bacterium]|nr:hypothetical protein [Xanthomonadaceae bacterium]